MFDEKVQRYLLWPIEFFLLFIIIFTPLFYGAVDNLPLSSAQLLSFTLFFLFYIQNKSFSLKVIYPSCSYLIIIFLFIVILQLLPLPNALLKVISPKTHYLYERYLTDLEFLRLHSLSFYSLLTKEELIKFISFLIVFFVPLNAFTEKKQFKRAFFTIIFLGLALAFYGVAKKYFILGKTATESFSTFGNRNHYAGYMVMVAPLAISYAVYCENKFKRLIFGFIGAIICTSVFLSLSRAGSLSLVLSLLIMALIMISQGRTKNTYWIIGISVVLAVLLTSIAGVSPIGERFKQFWQGLFDRWQVARDSLAMIKDFPIFGIGWGNFRYVFTLYQKFSISPNYYKYLHNDHLQLVVETGLIGAALYFGFLFKIFWEIFSELKKRRDYFTKSVVLGGLCGLIGVIFHSFFDFNFHIPAISFLFWFILGLIYKCVQTHFYFMPKADIENEREKF
jgi:O-antigen ligase